MGAMSRHAASSSASPLTPGAGSGGLLDMLGGTLDANRDGSVVDDITGILGRALGRS